MRSLDVVVGSGGVGKTSVAAALGIASARDGARTLVMTFDPSRRLKDALGVGEAASDRAVRVALDAPGRLDASLLDAKATFDRLVERYAPGREERERILNNRFYANLSGSLAGVLEYMAVERLHEVAETERYDRIILDTPPTRQAIEFLQAPERVVGFLDSGALRIALRSWFDEAGRLRPTRRLGVLGRGVERFFDAIVGLDLLRDMADFFQAFAPLYAGFREHALAVRGLLTGPSTRFVLVTGPAHESIPDTMVLARTLVETGHTLGSVIVNRVHARIDVPTAAEDARWGAGLDLFRWLAARDAEGVAELRGLLGAGHVIAAVPELVEPPGDVATLETLADVLVARLGAAGG